MAEYTIPNDRFDPMVIYSKRIVMFLLVAASFLSACSPKEVLFENAQKSFVVGMLPEQVRKAYGKPNFVTEHSGATYWNYYPERQLAKEGAGAFIAYEVEFRDGKTTRILPHSIVKGPPAR